MAVSGVCAGVLEENCWKVPGKLLEIFPRILPNATNSRISGTGKANLPGTLGRHSRDLVPTFRAGCFSKSTVPAFSSFSDKRTQENEAMKTMKTMNIHRLRRFLFIISSLHGRKTPSRQHTPPFRVRNLGIPRCNCDRFLNNSQTINRRLADQTIKAELAGSEVRVNSLEWSTYPKDPAVLKTLRDSELLRRSVFTTPPQIYYAVNPSLRGKISAIPWLRAELKVTHLR